MKRKFNKKFKLFLKRLFILSCVYCLTVALARFEGDITGAVFVAMLLIPGFLSDDE